MLEMIRNIIGRDFNDEVQLLIQSSALSLRYLVSKLTIHNKLDLEFEFL